MVREKVRSWEELQAQIEAILERLHADPKLALAAAINPLAALEEIGYQIEPQARPLIEERLRFEPRLAVRRRQLREEISRHAGRAVQFDSAEDLRALLFDELKLRPPVGPRAQQVPAGATSHIDTRPLPPQLSYLPKVADPLEQLRGAHPIIEPLLEYRRLEASAPQLAPRHLYDAVRQGRVTLPFSRIRARLKARPSGAPTPTPSPVPSPGPPAAPGAPMNINTASTAELSGVRGLGPELARRIVDYRLAFGPFTTVESLTEIKGIGEALLARLRPHITV